MNGYIDPGSFGLISQVGYLILFSFLSIVLFFWHAAKSGVASIRRTLANAFGRVLRRP